MCVEVLKCSRADQAEQKSDFGFSARVHTPFWGSQAMVPGPPAAPGGARDHLRAQGRRLGISGDDLSGGGGPGARKVLRGAVT